MREVYSVMFFFLQYSNQTYRGTVFQAFRFRGGPGSLSHDFKIWPICFQGSGLSGPILFSCEKSHSNKNIHLTASLQTQQNRKLMLVVNTVIYVLSFHSKKTKQRS